MRLGGILFFVGWIGTAAMASAGPIENPPDLQTFTVENGTFADDATLSGSLVIDTANGIVSSGDLFVTGIPLTDGNTLSSIEFTELNYAGGLVNIDANDNIWSSVDLSDPSLNGPGIQLDLYLGTATSLVDYTGGQICTFPQTGDANCGGFASDYYLNEDPLLTSGSLSPASATPEPASVWLILGPVAWVVRRQRLSSIS